MIPYIGNFAEDETIYHYFNTFDSNDPSASVTITNLADTDIYVYKDGAVADLATDGATVVIDFDARTGVHKLTIDTSIHADYSTGSDYMVLIEGTTIDAGTVTAGVFTFSIENRYNDVNVVSVAGTAQTANDNGADINAILADTADLQANQGNWLTVTGHATEAKQDIIDANVDQIEAAVITNAAGVDIAADIIAVKAETALIVADTNELQTDDIPGAIAALNDVAATDIVSAGAITTLAGAVANVDLVDVTTTNTDMRGTDSAYTGTPPTSAAIADAVLDEALSGHIAAGSLGKAVADIESDATAILADTNELQADDVPGLIAALNDPTVGAIADAVWDEAQSGHVTAGTFGLYLDTEVSGVGGGTAASIADAVWDELLSGHAIAGSAGEALSAAGTAGDPWTTALPGAYGAGTAGKIIGDNINAPLDTIDAVVDGIQADLSNGTDGLGAIKTSVDAIPTTAMRGTDNAATASALATVDTNVDSVLVDTAEIGSAGAGLTALATAAALATVDGNVDAILVDTGTSLPADIAAVPTATENADALLNRDMSAVSDTIGRSPLNALRFLRNKYSITGSTLTVTKEDDSTSAWTSALTTDAAADPVTGSDPA